MGNKSAAESAATRQAIVNTARKLFTDKGFAGATTSEIAKSAGLTEGAFFHHFKDKRALLTEVVKQIQREFAAEVFKFGSAGQNAFDRFILGARHSLELSQRPEYLRLVLVEAPTVLGGTKWRQIDSAISLAVLEPALADIAGIKDIPSAKLKAMALMILGLLNETAFALAREDTGITANDVIALLEESIRDWVQRLG
ncbi:MAG: TetR/AcrR family transcriptional regulator [Sphingopyxis sp.]|nr:TetR/AcrR family transcriptional regulator [Sphingopyxis sp.]